MRSQNSSGAEIDVTVFISCYNEEAFITETIQTAIEALKITGHSHEIIVVDDVSRDNSVQKVREYIKAHPSERIELIENKVNRGQAYNYVEAAFRGKGKYFKLCGGDDSEPLEVLVRQFKHIGVADIVVPWQDQGKIIGKTGPRRWLSRTFTFLVNTISGYHLKYYNGMGIHLRYHVMRWQPASYGFGFQADLITRLLDEGASYVQVPSFSTDRKGGTISGLGIRNFLSVGHTLLELVFRRIRRMFFGRTMPPPVEKPPLPDQ